MRRLVQTLAAAGLVAVLGTGFAEAQDKYPSAYDFEDDLVTGDLVRPDGNGITCTGTRRTRSLIRVRQDFVAQVVMSVDDL